MQVKVFESKDMASALSQVKEELGPDALILSSRTVRKGKLGPFAHPYVEVTAAVDSGRGTNKEEAKESNQQGFSQQTRARQVQGLAQYGIRSDQDKGTQKSKQLYSADYPLDAARLKSLQGEMYQLRQVMEGLLHKVSAVSGPGYNCQAYPEKCPGRDRAESNFSSVLQDLEAKGVSSAVAENMLMQVKDKLESGQLQDINNGAAQDLIANSVRFAGSLLATNHKQRRLALVGPTGVGKTTTLAKLAAHYVLHQGRKAALDTIDNYRIAAVEQLKVYGEIMELPVEIVTSPEYLPKIFEQHRDKDIIFIDTAGRSPNDDLSIQEMVYFLNMEQEVENHLVLSATTRQKDLEEAIRKFQAVPLHSLIFTKIDESHELGTILNIHAGHQYPLSYLTNGQKVPEDIMLAEPERVAEIVLNARKGAEECNNISNTATKPEHSAL